MAGAKYDAVKTNLIRLLGKKEKSGWVGWGCYGPFAFNSCRFAFLRCFGFQQFTKIRNCRIYEKNNFDELLLGSSPREIGRKKETPCHMLEATTPVGRHTSELF